MTVANRLWEASAALRARIPRAHRRGRAGLLPRKLGHCAHPAGFFSNFNKVMNHLVRSRSRPGINAIVADWSRHRIMGAPWLDGAATFNYGREEDGNLWERFFAPLVCVRGVCLVEVETH